MRAVFILREFFATCFFLSIFANIAKLSET